MAALLPRRALMLAPLGVAVLGGGAFYAMLNGMRSGTFDPRGLPSQLIGRTVPEFSLPAQPPSDQGFGAAELRAAGRPVLVNFFASWCVPCIEEHPHLAAVAKAGLPVWGIAYKDKPDAAAGFIRRNGDPYARIASDEAGRVAIDWGVYGVPESYFIDKDGVVRWRWAGALTDEVVAGQLRPLLRKYA